MLPFGELICSCSRTLLCQWSRKGACWEDDRCPLYPRPPRERAAFPPLAHRGELRRPTCWPTSVRASPCSTWAAVRAPSPATWPRRVAPGPVVGVDPSDDVLAEARSVCDRSRNGPRSPSRSGTVFALRFADGSFDVVHAHQVLQHVGDPVAALIEMRRVCRPGGVVAARDGDYPGFRYFPDDTDLDAGPSPPTGSSPGTTGPTGTPAGACWPGPTPPDSPGWPRPPRPGASPRPSDRDWWGGLWADRFTGVVAGRPAAGGRDRHARRSGCVRRGLAPVGGLTGRLVRGRPRRGPLHGLSAPRGASPAAGSSDGASHGLEEPVRGLHHRVVADAVEQDDRCVGPGPGRAGRSWPARRWGRRGPTPRPGARGGARPPR